MNTTQRTVLLALVIAVIASTLLAVDTDAKRKRKHRNRENRASIVRVDPNTRASLRDPGNLSQPVNRDISNPPALNPDILSQPVNPDIWNPPAPDPCDAAEATLNGFLPQTVTLTKSDSFWAKLTVKQGVSVLDCDLDSLSFEVRFNNTTIKTYGKASSNGISIGGWNHLASMSGEVRVRFTISFTPPNTVVLANLDVVDVNFQNSPNWLDSGAITDALNAIFPNTIAITI